jgi:hypothetical protein
LLVRLSTDVSSYQTEEHTSGGFYSLTFDSLDEGVCCGWDDNYWKWKVLIIQSRQIIHMFQSSSVFIWFNLLRSKCMLGCLRKQVPELDQIVTVQNGAIDYCDLKKSWTNTLTTHYTSVVICHSSRDHLLHHIDRKQKTNSGFRLPTNKDSVYQSTLDHDQTEYTTLQRNGLLHHVDKKQKTDNLWR